MEWSVHIHGLAALERGYRRVMFSGCWLGPRRRERRRIFWGSFGRTTPVEALEVLLGVRSVSAIGRLVEIAPVSDDRARAITGQTVRLADIEEQTRILR